MKISAVVLAFTSVSLAFAASLPQCEGDRCLLGFESQVEHVRPAQDCAIEATEVTCEINLHPVVICTLLRVYIDPILLIYDPDQNVASLSPQGSLGCCTKMMRLSLPSVDSILRQLCDKVKARSRYLQILFIQWLAIAGYVGFGSENAHRRTRLLQGAVLLGDLFRAMDGLELRYISDLLYACRPSVASLMSPSFEEIAKTPIGCRASSALPHGLPNLTRESYRALTLSATSEKKSSIEEGRGRPAIVLEDFFYLSGDSDPGIRPV
ncbi:hypothetical protein BV25DRAFT_1837556 [Artomyces pyxidatus]|uniref:Uncharacterized protein n=1 Tax=Artomyces pyxidatus TaxID=48021 RepID=A0ACB8T6N0_9AGAM|nr:hypothetical protein BV25DRAFT_1837556 [Artomyces pyxidatus]